MPRPCRLACPCPGAFHLEGAHVTSPWRQEGRPAEARARAPGSPLRGSALFGVGRGRRLTCHSSCGRQWLGTLPRSAAWLLTRSWAVPRSGILNLPPVCQILERGARVLAGTSGAAGSLSPHSCLWLPPEPGPGTRVGRGLPPRPGARSPGAWAGRGGEGRWPPGPSMSLLFSSRLLLQGPNKGEAGAPGLGPGSSGPLSPAATLPGAQGGGGS